MALNGDILGDLIRSECDAAFAALSDDDKKDSAARRQAIFRAFGAAIVAHFVSAAVVTGLATGVQGGPGTAPVTGVVS